MLRERIHWRVFLDNSNTIGIFSTPIYSANAKTVSDDTKQKLFNVPTERVFNNNCFVSSNNKILNEEQFLEIKNIIFEHVNYYVYDILKVNQKTKFELTTSWLVGHNKGDFAQPHIHTNSILSGVLYLKVPPNSGNIIFTKPWNVTTLFPPAIDVSFTEYNIFNTSRWIIPPKDNQIIIFPSFLLHEVTVSESDEKRYCLAFNLFPRGEFGQKSKIDELTIK